MLPTCAAVHTRFATRIQDHDHAAFEFDGVITMLVVRDTDSWHIVSGHSSTARPRG